jgi:tetratricopeptide (TPR) repeat protein
MPGAAWPLLQALAIAAAVFFVFWPSVHGQWIGDDNWYLPENPLMNDPHRLWKAWFAPGTWVEYYPIEETVQWAQWQLWHTDTFGYHFTNILLHLASALLFWRLLRKFQLPLAWLGGLIFAVHPMVVDSVAMINELKASLSLPPFLLAMGFWIDYEETGKRRDYLLALSLFLIAMLCKITMAPFPVVILLYAWWKRGRIGWADLRASVPFFLISLILGLTTIYAGTVYQGVDIQNSGDQPQGDLPFKFVLAGETIAFYFSRVILPLVPKLIYPEWQVDPHSPVQYLPWLVLGLVLGFLWTRRRTWGRHALLGLGFFLIMLMPFWGLHWASYMNATWILEHLLYIPILGLIGLAVAALGDISRQLPSPARVPVLAVVLGLTGLLAWESRAYAGVFRDEFTAASYALRFNPDSTLINDNLGAALGKQGRFDEAIPHFEAALRVDPTIVIAHLNLGNAYLATGRVDDAIVQNRDAIKLWPTLPKAHLALGNDFLQAGRASDALAEFKDAVRLDPDSAWMHLNLGLALRQQNQIPEAMAEYKKSIAIDPNNAETHNCLAITYILTGRTDEARRELEQALVLDPSNADARANLARIPSP